MYLMTTKVIVPTKQLQSLCQTAAVHGLQGHLYQYAAVMKSAMNTALTKARRLLCMAASNTALTA